MVGVISADPDGSGALKRRATRAAYDADGHVTVVEAGTVDGASDSDWAAFASAQQATATYDANARRIRDVTTAGGATYQVVQYSYDALGRLECSALCNGEGGGLANGALLQRVTVDKSRAAGGPAYDPGVQAKAAEALNDANTEQQRNPDGPPFREYGFTGRPYFFQFLFGPGFVTSDVQPDYQGGMSLGV